ncbi:FGGY-family carbohydrate kinase [Spirulina major]|uniref:FGGY-family carbohydrate kinase n=1 Tax=Spirulina major TaxID=270636 RepID=UPI0009326559|nr:FGGY-family carbohydrate kinase [Spirulina major]
MTIYIGLDFGTSGARLVAITALGDVIATAQVPWTDGGETASWQRGLTSLLDAIPIAVRQQTAVLAINGTSSTVILCDRTGQPLVPALLYNDDRGKTVKKSLAALAPPDHLVQSATSSLAKVLWWQVNSDCTLWPQARYLLHQADWLAAQLHGRWGITDYHNALKLGYDVEQLRYPDWLQAWEGFRLCPQVVEPGTPVGTVTAAVAARFGFPPDCQVCAGTTDSIAAFLASGVMQPGEAVTSLGSTLVLKLLSDRPVHDLAAGVYSHRLGQRWLTGGASNTGGAVLAAFFDPAELAALSEQIDGTQPSPLQYYPLLKPGDRFPINDPTLAPCLEPRPADSGAFLHGLLDSMARIEAEGYARLAALGATPLTQVWTAGGGAQNGAWMALRQRRLGVPVVRSPQQEAAYGTARLAQWQGLRQF